MRFRALCLSGIAQTVSWFHRFAILDGPTMPIIGEGEEEANDRYYSAPAFNSYTLLVNL